MRRGRRRRLLGLLLISFTALALSAGLGAPELLTPGDTADVVGTGQPGSLSLAAVRADAPGTVVSIRYLSVHGLHRGYLVVAPADPAGPLPLIVVLHGVTASATQEFVRDEFAPLAEAGAAILVYPAGYDESWNVGTGHCCGPAGYTTINDVGFVAAVVADVSAHFEIAAGQNYLVGYSNGGKLAYTVACRQPALFAAIAVVGAAPLSTCPAGSQPPIPMMITIGSADHEVAAYASSDRAPPDVLSSALSAWLVRDRCAGPGSTDVVGRATITTYRGCASGVAVQSVLYAGLTHLWPGAAQVGPAVSGATLIWAFFSSIHPAT